MESVLQRQVPRWLAAAALVAAVALAVLVARWRADAARAATDRVHGMHDQWIELADRVHRLKADGRLAEALQTAQRSLVVAEQAYGGSHPAVAESLNELAQLKAELAMFDGVDEIYARAIAIQSAVTGPESPEVAASVINLAVAWEKRGNYAEAERLYRRAVAM
jgi:tetratricopeptide (TPR) repeat protein